MDVNATNSNMSDYFRSSINRAADKRESQVLINKIHNEFGDFLKEIESFKGMFSLQVKDDSQPYQAPLRRLAYALQEPLRKS